MISAALVSILLGLTASNMGIIPHEACAYSAGMEFLLPLTILLMLFKADMRNVIKSIGKLLLAFLIRSIATMIGTLVAYLIVPMRSLGQDSWKIASALMASYIGGAINYVAVSNALVILLSVIAAGVAADNVICAIYFMALFALGSKLPTEASPLTKGRCFSCFLKAAADGGSEGGNITFSSQDGSRLFSVERLGSLGIMMQ
ncbi:ferric reduction oxidase 4 [Tanacetum coccineum]